MMKLTPRDVRDQADLLVELPGIVRPGNHIMEVLAKLTLQRRRYGGSELVGRDGTDTDVLTEALASQVACELGLWLTDSAAPAPSWPSYTDVNEEQEAAYAQLPEELRTAVYNTVTWIWHDDGGDAAQEAAETAA